jgi:hypothetical protein
LWELYRAFRDIYLWMLYTVPTMYQYNTIHISECSIQFPQCINRILYLSLNALYSSHNVSIEYYTYLWMLYTIPTMYQYNTIHISECCIQFPQCINRILYLSLNAVYSSHNVSIEYYTYIWMLYTVGEERDFSRKIWLLRVYWYTYWYIVGTVYSIQR